MKSTDPNASGDKSKAGAGATAAAVVSSPEADKLVEQITQQGEKVRNLKGNKSSPKVNIFCIRKLDEEMNLSD